VTIVDRLNDRFVAAARAVDALLRRARAAVRRKLLRPSATTENGARVQAAAPPLAPALTEQARARLSDLHLRVGECIYQMASGRQDAGPIERQLRALLDEVERVEEILRQVGAPTDGALAEVDHEMQVPLAVLDEGSVKE